MKELKSIFLFTLIISKYLVISQSPFDGLHIDLKELRFSSSSEEELFINLSNKTDRDFLSYFYEIGSNIGDKDKIEFKTRVKTICSKFYDLNENDKNFEKQLLKCFQTVHSEFLLKYDREADFNAILAIGEYNCLSGTALYALILDELKIPYHILEGDHHIYLMVSPDKHEILLESTQEDQGLFYLSLDDRAKYATYLIKDKYLDHSTYQIKNQVFEIKYSSTDKVINPRELLALQYFNLGLSSIDDNDLPKAENLLSKAAYLSSHELIHQALIYSVINQVPEDYDHFDSAFPIVCKFFNYGDTSLLSNFRDFVIDYFSFTINREDESALDTAHEFLSNCIKHASYIEVIECEYLFRKAYFLMSSSDYNSAFNMIDLYSNCQHDTSFKMPEIMADILFHGLKGHTSFLETFEYFKINCEKYPILLDVEIVRTTYLKIILMLTGINFSENQISEGLKYLNLYRDLCTSWHVDILEAEELGFGYGEASAYYIRIEEYEKAKKLINEGLKFSPNDETLTRKLQLMKSSGY
ncbi:MAG: hypothetical protein H6598_00015 [Flavobacteriales bacterium]|nr:hypothetical protein [Flavobacteriales bacterium]